MTTGTKKGDIIKLLIAEYAWFYEPFCNHFVYLRFEPAAPFLEIIEHVGRYTSDDIPRWKHDLPRAPAVRNRLCSDTLLSQLRTVTSRNHLWEVLYCLPGSIGGSFENISQTYVSLKETCFVSLHFWHLSTLSIVGTIV